MNCHHCKGGMARRGASVHISKYLNQVAQVGEILNFHWKCFLSVAGPDYYYALDERVRPKPDPCPITLMSSCDCARCRKERF